MASTYHNLLSRICRKGETLKKSKEYLSLAQAKTGPGSGLELGRKVVALPAVCAFLASERLGNNEVTKTTAQGASCLNIKDFESALSTVRGALTGHLGQKRDVEASYQALCRSHGLNEDALYWMEQVDKELRKSGELNDLDVDEGSVICMVFYWTCIALNIRSVKQATIISKYEVPLHIFQELEEILESTCYKLKEDMDRFIHESRGSRSEAPTPRKTPGRGPRKRTDVSPSKEAIDASPTPFSSPTKTPTKSAPAQGMLDSSPSKRKAALPPLPFMTPTKKQKTTSPIKLNRIPVTNTLATSSKNTTEVFRSTSLPTKTYGTRRSVLASPTKLALSEVAVEVEPVQRTTEAHSQESIVADPPATPVKNRAARRSVVEQATPSTPSPRRAVRSCADASTPTRARIRGDTRPRLNQLLDSDVQLEDTQTQETEEHASESSEDEETQLPPCRHGVPVFADRLFYHYRDPRVMREWEECQKSMKTLIMEHGNLFGDLAFR